VARSLDPSLVLRKGYLDAFLWVL